MEGGGPVAGAGVRAAWMDEWMRAYRKRGGQGSMDGRMDVGLATMVGER